MSALSLDEVTSLLGRRGAELDALCARADAVRRAQVGDVVRYVVNRNINFTNVCVKRCRFCAYARGLRSEQGYLLPEEEVVRRALEAVELGATEVCLQAGLLPDDPLAQYLSLTRAIKAAAPTLHLHAFSPEEVKHAARVSRVSIADVVEALRDAGVGSLPGTSAEILDDEVRARIAPGRITTAEWGEVLRAAHRIGLPTTSTIMFGHVESERQRAAHLLHLRQLQEETGGITELVPLSFIAAEAPLALTDATGAVRRGPTEDEVRALFATARLVLGDVLPNLQVSWVKEGPERAVRLLACGANDLGGTLVNESISVAAGAGFGQRMSPAALRELGWRAGRPVQERTTLYAPRGPVWSGPDDLVGQPLHPLDDPSLDDSRLGSYAALVADPRFRYEPAAARGASRATQRRQSEGVSRSRAVPGESIRVTGR